MNPNNSPAILAKARAMYGNRITNVQYDGMIKCRTVSEVAVFLKKQTHFSTALAQMAETNVHRGQLESTLRRAEFDDYGRLYRYLLSTKKTLYQFVVMEEEISEILRMVLLLTADNAKDFILDLPGYLIHASKVDLLAVARATTFDELIAVLHKGEYTGILRRFHPKSLHEPINYVAIEHAFYEYFYKKFFAVIQTNYRGSERLELLDLLKTKVEMANLNQIYRAVFYLNISKANVVQSIYPYYHRLSQSQLNSFLDTKVKGSPAENFQKTPYNKFFPDQSFPYIEDYTDRILYRTARSRLHLSTHASVVFYSYYLLTRAELSNTINIIEGIRYQVSEEEIQKLIIYS